MTYLSSRAQLRLVAFGYAAVFAVAAMLLYCRHLQELKYPLEASGGMWAAGDAFLYVFIACIFMMSKSRRHRASAFSVCTGSWFHPSFWWGSDSVGWQLDLIGRNGWFRMLFSSRG